MSKQVNIHHKRFADFLHYLKEHQAEITVHSPGGDRMTYTFRKNGPLIKSLVCQALDENETVVSEYFRQNLQADNISTRKRKAFYRRVNIIHDINSTYPRDELAPIHKAMLRGDTVEAADLHRIYPQFTTIYAGSISKLLEICLDAGPQVWAVMLSSEFPFREEVNHIMNHFETLLEQESFREQLDSLTTLYSYLARTNTEQTFFYPDYTFLHKHDTARSFRNYTYARQDYEGPIQLDEQRCKKLWYGKYLFSKEHVTDWPVSYTAHLLLSFFEYVALILMITNTLDPGFETDIRFQINASTDGISVEYGKANLTLDDLAEELSYYHFHKNPEQLISKDPFHLLTEEIKKNKTGSPSHSVDKEMLKSIISNRIKEKYLGSVMKTFGYA